MMKIYKCHCVANTQQSRCIFYAFPAAHADSEPPHLYFNNVLIWPTPQRYPPVQTDIKKHGKKSCKPLKKYDNKQREPPRI